MPLAVRFDEYGDVDVLKVVEVARPVPGTGQVLVKVVAAGINPGEASIRKGLLHAMWPATFPSGEGSDLAGVVEELGPGVDRFAVGDEVLGYVDTRASHAELVVAEVGNLVARPSNVPWDVAGSLFVAGTTAYAAVRAVNLVAGDTVVVSGAAGGVGSLAVQLAVDAGRHRDRPGQRQTHHPWLAKPRGHPGALRRRSGRAHQGRRATGRSTPSSTPSAAGTSRWPSGWASPPTASTPSSTGRLPPSTGPRPTGARRRPTAEVLGELAGLIAEGRLEIPIAKTYPLTEVRDAFTELEQRHTLGKIVLEP